MGYLSGRDEMLAVLVQAADTERSVYISNLLPLLAEFDLQPTVTDAHSMVSAIKVMYARAYSTFHDLPAVVESWCPREYKFITTFGFLILLSLSGMRKCLFVVLLGVLLGNSIFYPKRFLVPVFG